MMTTRDSTGARIRVPVDGPHTSHRPPSGRAAELGLLVLVAVIVTSALTLVELNQNRAVSWDLAWYGGAFLTVFAIAHFIVRVLAPFADPLLLPVVALLNGLGLVMIHRLDLAAAVRATLRGNDTPRPEAIAQLVWTGVGLVFFLVVLMVIKHHSALRQYAYTLAFVGLVFLATPAVLGLISPSLAPTINGANIWLRIPGVLSIQPAEFTKIALIVFAASYLASKRTVLSTAGKKFLGLVLPRARDLGPLMIAVVVALGVLFYGKDLGTALLLFGVFLAMIYFATGRASWLVIGLLAFAGGAYVAYLNFGHVQQRVDIWLDPFADPFNDGYQLVQSLLSLGTGGIFGTGLGAGRPDFVPFASTDFITAAIGEELGLVGLAAVLLCYLILASRGMRIGMAVRDDFGKLLAAGLGFSLAFQVFVVVGGVTALIPLTGLTSPFLSYGGSSLLANYISIALLLRISDASRRPRPKPKPAAPLSDAMTQAVPISALRGTREDAATGPKTPPDGTG
ncbi:FtsW/RodA/SpoVE family cell cycle protein [Nakamurella deserti]|uniref:FtsW/RodA/SpoVE family cell cycle protein n=1 Tax=Nakamurella deserti TaxID=2164074 RepID=UPI003B82FDB6